MRQENRRAGEIDDQPGNSDRQAEFFQGRKFSIAEKE
jgi:hypothetical protein